MWQIISCFPRLRAGFDNCVFMWASFRVLTLSPLSVKSMQPYPDPFRPSDALPLGRLWYGEPNEASNSIDYAKFRSRSHDAPVVTVIGKAFWNIGHAPAARPFSESFLKFLRTSLL